ncbi:MAG: hypothetical protein IKW90_16215 [Lachnospiraceae bacterium]|nr:hypothetical protein [Lachnospiraceae bacterium]
MGNIFLDVLNLDFLVGIGNAFQYIMIVVGIIIFTFLCIFTIKDVSDYKSKKVDKSGELIVTYKQLKKVITFDIIYVGIILAYILIRMI